MKKNAGLGPVIVMQMIGREDVDQVFRQDSSIRLVLQVVCRQVILRTATNRIEQPGRRVQFPSGQELEGQEWVCGTDDAKVDLERVNPPRDIRVVARDKKVDAESADRALLCENPADAQTRVLNLKR